MNEIMSQIEKLIQENKQLKEENYNHKLTLDKLKTRDTLYMSELQKTKNALQKLANNIDTTPHSTAEEYEHFYEYDHKIHKYKDKLDKIKEIVFTMPILSASDVTSTRKAILDIINEDENDIARTPKKKI